LRCLSDIETFAVLSVGPTEQVLLSSDYQNRDSCALGKGRLQSNWEEKT
jgi:hypothetical protein